MLKYGKIISHERAMGSTMGAGAVIHDEEKLRAFTAALDSGMSFNEAMRLYGPEPEPEPER